MAQMVKEYACNTGGPGSIPGSGRRVATHLCILAWRIPWTEEPGNPQGHKESDMTEMTEHTCTHLHHN